MSVLKSPIKIKIKVINMTPQKKFIDSYYVKELDSLISFPLINPKTTLRKTEIKAIKHSFKYNNIEI